LLPSIQSIIYATAMILDGGGSRCHGLVGHDSITLGAVQHRASAVRRMGAAMAEMRASG